MSVSSLLGSVIMLFHMCNSAYVASCVCVCCVCVMCVLCVYVCCIVFNNDKGHLHNVYTCIIKGV